MRVVLKKGFDQSKVTENNYISLAQFEYAVFFEENYEEEIASGESTVAGAIGGKETREMVFFSSAR